MVAHTLFLHAQDMYVTFKIALKVQYMYIVSNITCSFLFVCWHRFVYLPNPIIHFINALSYNGYKRSQCATYVISEYLYGSYLLYSNVLNRSVNIANL